MTHSPIIVIGAGAAGFFAAIQAKTTAPHVPVIILEKTNKTLSKVRISGGGRCNVTHDCVDNRQLVTFYPRGGKSLLGPFSRFSVQDTINWFKARGVVLKTEADGRMFPITDSSETIAQCLELEAQALRINLHLQEGVQSIVKQADGSYIVTTTKQNYIASKIIISSGGSGSLNGFGYLDALGFEIAPPVPSLFTFNTPGEPIKELMGISVPKAHVSLPAFKLQYTGPVLITHWGLSGPAVLRLSSEGARYLSVAQYQTPVVINWLPQMSSADFQEWWQEQRNEHGTRSIKNCSVGLPQRLWEYLLSSAGILPDLRVADISKKLLNALETSILRHSLQQNGKTTYKEEFVTCGGIKLAQIDMKTMESKVHKGIHFAGEVLDIDGVTGGFNFQAAWTTGFLAGMHAAVSTV
jgi:predicted Rossmann fold flavoprotein